MFYSTISSQILWCVKRVNLVCRGLSLDTSYMYLPCVVTSLLLLLMPSVMITPCAMRLECLCF